MIRCHGCHWSRDVMPWRDADGRRFYLCPDCLPRANADKAAALEARARAAEGREREQAGQLRLPGTGDAHKAKEPPLTLF